MTGGTERRGVATNQRRTGTTLLPSWSRYCLPALLVWTWLASAPAFAEPSPTQLGQPLVRRFSPDDFDAGPNSTGLAVHADGRLFVANDEGVLQFDGSTWQVFRLPGGQLAREIRRGPDDRLYVAGINQFGVMEESPEGDLGYRELSAAPGLAETASAIGQVWQVLPVSTGVWFRGEQDLFFYATAPNHANKRIPLKPETRAFYVVNDELYGRMAGLGLVREHAGRLEAVPGTDAFAEQGLNGLLPWDGGLLLVGADGFFLHQGRTLERLPSAADGLLGERGIKTSILLADGTIAAGTWAGDVLRFDRQLQLRNRVHVASTPIQALAVDLEAGLWVAAQNGLARLRMPSRWSTFGEEAGLQGVLLDSEAHAGYLWVASTNGLLRLAASSDGRMQTERMPWTPMEAYAVRSTEAGLLVGHRQGLLVVEGDASVRPLIDGPIADALLRSRFDPARVYVQGRREVWLLRLAKGQWRLAGRWPQPANRWIVDMVETAPGELWLGGREGGPRRLRFDAEDRLLSQKEYGAAEGLDTGFDSDPRLFLLDGELHIAAAGREFELRGERFEPTTSLPGALLQWSDELRVEASPLGLFAVARREAFFRPNGGERWRPVNLGQSTRYISLRTGSDGVLRMSTASGQLLQYDPQEAPPAEEVPLQVRLASVEARLELGERRRLPANTDPPALPAGTFVILQPVVATMEPGVEMRFWSDDQAGWTDWLNQRPMGFTLDPGDNVVRIEARTRSGRQVMPLSYRIRGEPRWYQTSWAGAFAGLGGLGLIFVAGHGWIRWRLRRYQRYQASLERRITERTHELQEANRRLEELAVEDALTGIANRRALEQGLWREWHRNRDLRRPLAVLMIDVDHFKRINDTLGHAGGDEVLRAVAALLQTGHDPTLELLARYGGEEFALLLPGAPPDEAAARAEQLRSRVEEAGHGATVSIGVAVCVPTAADHPHRLLRHADEALYRAKHAGRNRVEISD